MEAVETTVALVDDKPIEIKEIVDNLNALEINHIEFQPSLDMDSMSIQPLQMVRIIFLDLYYQSRSLQDLDPYVPAAWVDRIVPNTEHEYFLVLWTKETDDAFKVLNVLNQLGKFPVGHLAANKRHYEIEYGHYQIGKLFDNIPAEFLEVPSKSVEEYLGQVLDIQSDHVLIRCRISVEPIVFQTRRFDLTPLKRLNNMRVGGFLKVVITTEPGKRTFEFLNVNEDYTEAFMKKNYFEGLESSPFIAKARKL